MAVRLAPTEFNPIQNIGRTTQVKGSECKHSRLLAAMIVRLTMPAVPPASTYSLAPPFLAGAGLAGLGGTGGDPPPLQRHDVATTTPHC